MDWTGSITDPDVSETQRLFVFADMIGLYWTTTDYYLLLPTPTYYYLLLWFACSPES